MNRRAFLGFACGGVVAAPAAFLVGEKPIEYAAGVSDIQPLQPITVEISTFVTQEQAHRIAVRAVAVAMQQAEDVRRRGGFSYGARKSGIDVQFLSPSNSRG